MIKANTSKTYELKNDIILFVVLLVVSLAAVYLNDMFNNIVLGAVIGLIGFVTVFYVSLRYPRYNVPILITANFLFPWMIKVTALYTVPFGIVNDALVLMMLLTLTINKRITGIRTLPAILLFVWITYQIIELGNPFAASRIAGLFSVRVLIPCVSAYFIMYSSIDTKRDAYTYMYTWLGMGALAGFYGLWQEFVGLPGYDVAWTLNNEAIYNLLFTWGRLRKFSFFFSPSEFGMLMSITGAAGMIVFFFAKDKWLRILGGAAALLCSWSMIYTGSRTAMVMLPAGLAVFAALTLNPRVLVALALIGAGGAVMLLRPASGAMWVMSTAFQGSDDPSMRVRIENRELIRSYIHSNPIGYGLGGTGFLGARYSPNTFIGSFQTDSEYVRIAVEAGWIGLFIWCVILSIIYGYMVAVNFRVHDEEWRVNIRAIVVAYFMILVAMYAQELFTSQLLAILMTSMIALVARIDYKTKPKTEATDEEYEGS